ncbi:MAG: thioredoxin fold domain-containing protein [Syntrophobacteraceae bacterium]
MFRDYFRTVLLSVLLLSLASANLYGADSRSFAAKPGQDKGQNPTEGMKAIVEEAIKKEAGQTTSDKAAAVKVQEGDLAKVNYTVMSETGELISTTEASVAQDTALRKSPQYIAPKEFAPEEVLAGKPGLPVGLGDVAVGMVTGEKKKFTLSPDKAYGTHDPNKKMDIPSVQTMPKTIRMSPEDYVQRFHSFPVVGKQVGITPFFNAIILEVAEGSALLECMPRHGERYEESFGITEVKVEGETVRMILTPRLGAPFEVQGNKGRIVSADGNAFTVDFNNPLAGKSVVLDLQVVSLTKASDLDAMRIEWVENHDEGLSLAKQKGTPAVMVLYADWCSFCKKLFSESLHDPRVRVLKEQFVWIKVNSDVNQNIKEMYGQAGFPLIVLLNSEGKIIHKIDGFRDALAFRQELISSSKALQSNSR